MNTSPGKRVLIAEDNPALAGVIRFNLSRAGFDVTSTRNGREALEAASDQMYDIVLTDQQMPEMTGTQLCTKLRCLDSYRETPIIMLTAKGLEMDIEQLREQLGVCATLPKPFSPLELIDLVEKSVAAELSATSC